MFDFYTRFDKSIPTEMIAAMQKQQYAERPAEKEHMTIQEFHNFGPDEELGGATFDWKSVCKKQVVLDTNWRKGVCRNEWIAYGPGIDVYAIDDEEESCIMIYSTEQGEVLNKVSTCVKICEKNAETTW